FSIALACLISSALPLHALLPISGTGSSGAHSSARSPRRHTWRCRARAATAGPAATAAAVAPRTEEVAGGESGMDGSRAVRADRPRGVLPPKGRLDTPGEDHLPPLRGAAGVPGLRARRRRDRKSVV